MISDKLFYLNEISKVSSIKIFRVKPVKSATHIVRNGREGRARLVQSHYSRNRGVG